MSSSSWSFHPNAVTTTGGTLILNARPAACNFRFPTNIGSSAIHLNWLCTYIKVALWCIVTQSILTIPTFPLHLNSLKFGATKTKLISSMRPYVYAWQLHEDRKMVPSRGAIRAVAEEIRRRTAATPQKRSHVNEPFRNEWFIFFR